MNRKNVRTPSNYEANVEKNISTFLLLSDYLLANTTKNIYPKINDDIEGLTSTIAFDIQNTLSDPDDSWSTWKQITLSKLLLDIEHLGLYARYYNISGEDLLCVSIENSDLFILFANQLYAYYLENIRTGNKSTCLSIQESFEELINSLVIQGFYCLDDILGYSELIVGGVGFESTISDDEFSHRYFELLELFHYWDRIFTNIEQFQFFEPYNIQGLLITKKWFDHNLLHELSILIHLYKSGPNQLLMANTKIFNLEEIFDPTSPSTQYTYRIFSHRIKWVSYKITNHLYNKETLIYLSEFIALCSNQLEEYLLWSHNRNSNNKEQILSESKEMLYTLYHLSRLISSSTT